jgi:hypothetical protein
VLKMSSSHLGVGRELAAEEDRLVVAPPRPGLRRPHRCRRHLRGQLVLEVPPLVLLQHDRGPQPLLVLSQLVLVLRTSERGVDHLAPSAQGLPHTAQAGLVAAEHNVMAPLEAPRLA